MLAKEQRFIDRFKTHAAKAAQVQSRIKALDKIEKIELPKKRQVVKFEFRAPPRSGDQVAVIEDLHKTFGQRVIYDGLNLTVRRGERWAVMGKNGAGKTTLLKMMAGALAPDAGEVRLGASLKMGYFAQQSLDVLDPDLTRHRAAAERLPAATGWASLRTLAGAFQFSGDDVDKKIRALSGGEKSRLAMARMLYNPPNFLVLDEPTNHLDLATKEMLVDALKDFEGTMIFVSHDRMFLRGLGSGAGAGRRERDQPRAAGLPRQLYRVRAEDRARSPGHAHLGGLARWRPNAADSDVGRTAAFGPIVPDPGADGRRRFRHDVRGFAAGEAGQPGPDRRGHHCPDRRRRSPSSTSAARAKP